MVERGFSALAAMVQTWDESSDEFKEHENSRWRSGCATIAKTFSSLLQQAWIMPIQQKVCILGNLKHLVADSA